jgi:ABC-type enterobactin transport system permease subunit
LVAVVVLAEALEAAEILVAAARAEVGDAVSVPGAVFLLSLSERSGEGPDFVGIATGSTSLEKGIVILDSSSTWPFRVKTGAAEQR